MNWRRWVAAVAIGVSAFGVAACDGGDSPDLPETETETETEIPEIETETEIPGVDAPEVEVDG